jgi:uncharacterized protein
MKKTRILYSIILLTLIPFFANCQSYVTKCKIGVVARYTNTGTELRWIPDNKTILRLGFDNSYSIERSDSGLNRFETIATVNTFSRSKWDSLVQIEQNPEIKSNLEMISDFLFTDKNDIQKSIINLDKGIAELNEQKGKEDLIYAVFVLTAIKDARIAEALGLGFIDKTTKTDRTYTYRIKLNGKSPIYEIEEGTINIKATLNPDKYKNEVFVYPGDKKLSFAWSSKPELSGYFVERAANGETVFKPLNTTPIYASKGLGFDGPTNGSFEDDSLTNYKTYRYRFFGNTAFGEKVMFAEVSGMPRDLTPPNNPILKLPKHVKAKEVLIAWDIYGDLSDLRGFIVARSDKDSGNFQVLHKTLLSNTIRNYVDTTFDQGGINYYVVYAIDTSGNISSSYPAYVALVDSIPPAKPQILSAIIDSLGVVTIKVKPGLENDLKGYRLFKSNSPEHEFSVIAEYFKKEKSDTNAIQTVFADTVTLESLTPNIFYRVKALDFNYNQSEFSNIVEVTRPDTIHPVDPVLTNVVVSEKQVELYFVPSSSKDVVEQIIYRKTDLNSDWILLKTFDSANTRFIDTNVTTGVTYFYSIRAKDKSGLYSNFASAVYGKPYDTGIRPPVNNLTANIEKKNIILKWDYTSSNVEAVFVIYKKDNRGLLREYDMTTEKSYTDKNTNKENFYAVKVVTKDGGQSNLSGVVGKIIE